MIHVIGPKDPKHPEAILTVSRSTTWSKGLSPFYLGPIECYDGMFARNMENAWQFSKVYAEFAKDGEPTEEYFKFRNAGWADSKAHRYPVGKGVKPLYSLWKFADGPFQKLTYIEARKRVYVPLYARAVVETEAYKTLADLYKQKGELWLWDFDGYDHRKLGYTYEQVYNDPVRKAGHAFVLAMLLEGVAKVH